MAADASIGPERSSDVIWGSQPSGSFGGGGEESQPISVSRPPGRNTKLLMGAGMASGMIVVLIVYLVFTVSSGGAAQKSTSTISASTTTIHYFSSKYTVGVAYNSTVGNYLINRTGFTLYFYTPDVPYSGRSACIGQCATFWPPFYTRDLALPSALNRSDFNVITTASGEMQLTYEGRPLYLFTGNRAPGEMNGSKFGGFVVATPKRAAG